MVTRLSPRTRALNSRMIRLQRQQPCRQIQLALIPTTSSQLEKTLVNNWISGLLGPSFLGNSFRFESTPAVWSLKKRNFQEMKVPTTFNEMLLFNASVMGYGSSTWMNIVLQQFDDMAAWLKLFWNTELREKVTTLGNVNLRGICKDVWRPLEARLRHRNRCWIAIGFMSSALICLYRHQLYFQKVTPINSSHLDFWNFSCVAGAKCFELWPLARGMWRDVVGAGSLAEFYYYDLTDSRPSNISILSDQRKREKENEGEGVFAWLFAQQCTGGCLFAFYPYVVIYLDLHSIWKHLTASKSTKAKYKGKINLPEFKAVTLASLRSLLPAEWDSEHEAWGTRRTRTCSITIIVSRTHTRKWTFEIIANYCRKPFFRVTFCKSVARLFGALALRRQVAWGWLWENIEGLLSAMLGKPKQQEDALEKFYRQLCWGWTDIFGKKHTTMERTSLINII